MPYTGGAADADPVYGPHAVDTDDLRSVMMADAGAGLDPTPEPTTDLTLSDIKTGLSAGGDDPITNVDSGFAVRNVADDGDAFVATDDGSGNPVFRVYDAAGEKRLEYSTSGESLQLFDSTGLTVSNFSQVAVELYNVADPDNIFLATDLIQGGVSFVSFDGSGATLDTTALIISDGAAHVTQVRPGNVSLYNFGGDLLASLKDDGTGLTLYDAMGANPAVLSYDNLVALLALL